MRELELKNLTETLGRLFEDDKKKPFPYEDCRKISVLGRVKPGDLIPDLDLYFSKLAGYCSWDGRILKWPHEKVAYVRKDISKSFFEKHPEYQPLRETITETVAPDLFSDLALHEEMRQTLLKILDSLMGAVSRTD